MKVGYQANADANASEQPRIVAHKRVCKTPIIRALAYKED
jgi:hypothetical protein